MAKQKCSRPEVPRVKARPQLAAGLVEKLSKKEDAEKPSKKEDPGKSDGGKPTSSQPGPFWGPHAKIQPAEETKGKEWREKVYEDEWKLDVRSGAMRSNLPRTFYPFSPEWQEKVQKTLWHLAHRGFNLNSEGEQAPVRPYPWQLHSYREFREINDDLQNRFGIRLIWRAQECKGRSRAMDEWHCYPIGRGKMEKTDRAGNPDTVLGSLPPSKGMCSVCWSEGHWKNQCKLKEMVFELWEPALTVLQPKEILPDA